MGIVPYLLAAVTGTAALLRASGIAFDALRILGIAYLLVMAVATLRDKCRPVVADDQPSRSPARVIGSAVLANVLNPKLTVFFFCFPAAVRPTPRPPRASRLLVLSATFMAMTFIVFVMYGVGAAAVRRHLIDPPQGRAARPAGVRGVFRRPGDQARRDIPLTALPVAW